MATNHTKVYTSEQKIDLGGCATITEEAVTCVKDLRIVDSVGVNEHITVLAKVVSVGVPQSVQKRSDDRSLMKQDCTIADSAATCRVVVGKLSIDELESIVVR